MEGAAGGTPLALHRMHRLQKAGPGFPMESRLARPWAVLFAGGLPLQRMVEPGRNRISKARHSSSATLTQHNHFNGIDQNDDIEK
jgi:hypothetical protein